MKIGIISDIHGYQAPLKLVLNAIRDKLGYRGAIYNLGDITSGGDQEKEVINWLKGYSVISVNGNHCRQTRSNFGNEKSCTKPNEEDIQKYLKKLTPYIEFEDRGKKYSFVHDNPLCVIGNKEAMMGLPPWQNDSGIKNVEHARRVFDKCDSDYIFVGHSHTPAHWELTQSGEIIETIQGDGKINEGSRYIINPGAVAEPKVLTPHSVAHPKPDFDANYLIFNLEDKLIQRYRIPIFREGKPVIPIRDDEKSTYR